MSVSYDSERDSREGIPPIIWPYWAVPAGAVKRMIAKTPRMILIGGHLLMTVLMPHIGKPVATL